MSAPMLTCGCRAHATQTLADGTRVPSCIVHSCHEVAPEPDLAGRTARCSCGTTRPSDSTGLAFFEYRGPGSPSATEKCKTCRYHAVAHHPRTCNRCNGTGRTTNAVAHPCHYCDGKGTTTPAAYLRGAGGHGEHPFEPHGPWDTDVYYCGCRGWD